MRTRIKVCCIETVANAQLAVRHGADAIGLVMEMPTGTGVIDADTGSAIVAAVPPPVSTVLLTSHTDAEGIVRQVRHCRADTVQIVDAVDPNVYAVLRRELPGVRLVQALHVCSDDVVAAARDIAPLVDALLLDSGNPNGPNRDLGGTGRVHDWAISARVVAAVDKPVFLAGGLRPDNVAKAIDTVRPFAVDLCSGLRTDDRLDPGKLAAFVAAVAGA